MDPADARTRLDEERQRLDGIRTRLNGVREVSEEDDLGESTAGQHQADVGTETFEREKDVSIIEQVEAELADVEHALRRLDEGTYGLCEACGKPIGDARLDAIPAARLCVDDQAQAERQANFGT